MRSIQLIIALLTCLLTVSLSQAQTLVPDSASAAPPPSDSLSADLLLNRRAYSGYFTSVGARTFLVTASHWGLDYLDHSPTTDRFSGERTLKARAYAPTIRAGVHWGKLRGSHVELGGNFALGHSNYNALQVGLGLNLAKRFVFRPVVAGEFGFAGFKLGSLRNHSSYVQVDDTRFYDDLINIKLVSWRANVTPRLDIGLINRQGTQVYASLGYTLNVLATRSLLQFRGQDAEGESVTAYESIDAPNVSLRQNGERANGQLPFDLDGYFASLTIGF